MTDRWGELAALGTAFSWAGSALFFTRAGRRIGSLVVNQLRLWIALPCLCLVAWAMRGQALPTDASGEAWIWLAASGVIGFVIGDMCLFRAFLVIGPRLSSLLMSTAPLMTALLGWALLGEAMTPLDLCGMTLTVTGITWAIASRPPAAAAPPPRLWGVVLGLGGALGQALGLVLSKRGMADYSALASTQIRVIAAIPAWMVVIAIFRRWPAFWSALRDRPGLSYTAVGALFGPICGVTLSLLAVQHATAGVAASIMATTPILLIPVTRVFENERTGLGGVLGTVAAVIGVSLLFL